ncbi:MAG: hypothetical protein ABI887_15175 [Burkholderiales bacterium]
MTWSKFIPTGAFVSAQTLTQVDPYLAWAESTGFAHQRWANNAAPMRVPVIIELHGGKTSQHLQTQLGTTGTVRAAYLNAGATGFCVADLSAAACLAAFATPLNGIIKRFEYVAPVISQRPTVRRHPVATSPAIPRAIQPSGPTVLLGVIDFGCAFANTRFRQGTSSRLLNIWDQDPRPAFGTAPAAGGVPSDFGYGREIDQSKVNAMLSACLVPGTATVDEDACYELAAYPELRHRAVHGTHVLDQFAGGGTDDIVFVQLPRDAWADPAGNALAPCVLDGLRYIISCAGATTTRIVVNISCAFYTGPHNQTSVLELALADLVAEQLALGRALLICMPTGNAFGARWHAEGQVLPAKPRKVTVRVPPDNEVPTFVQVWMACSGAAASVKVTPPGSAVPASGSIAPGQASVYGAPGRPWATVVHTASDARGQAVPSQNSSMAVLFIEPTSTPDRPGADAPSGDWIVEVQGHSSTKVRVYVGRTETEMDLPMRARAARLIHPDDHFDQPSPAEPDDPSPTVDNPSNPNLPTLRRNTMSGVSTSAGVKAVAGYLGASNGSLPQPSPYSSAGKNPADTSVRPQPTASALADESRALIGTRGAGSRSGSIVRLSGVSFASPRYAKHLIPGTPKALPPPGDIGRMGSEILP